jgi:hypothetical protein
MFSQIMLAFSMRDPDYLFPKVVPVSFPISPIKPQGNPLKSLPLPKPITLNPTWFHCSITWQLRHIISSSRTRCLDYMYNRILNLPRISFYCHYHWKNFDLRHLPKFQLPHQQIRECPNVHCVVQEDGFNYRTINWLIKIVLGPR